MYFKFLKLAPYNTGAKIPSVTSRAVDIIKTMYYLLFYMCQLWALHVFL